MQNNSKINTGLLVIIIILLCVGIWLLSHNRESKEVIVNTPTIDKKIETKNIPVGKKIETKTTPVESKTTASLVLQTLFKNLMANSGISGGAIDECIFNGQTFYTVSPNAYDGGMAVYDESGASVGGVQGFTGKATGFQPNNCKTIYVTYPNIWGKVSVNTYNLK